MKQIVPFSKKIEFNTNVDEIREEWKHVVYEDIHKIEINLSNENIIHVKKDGIEYIQFRKLVELCKIQPMLD